jgi:tetratricopeptide (TPR) repeat protein/Cdc6-like AAA superfamily ATPase
MGIEDHEEEINELAGKIASGKCALFTGAGLSINSGAPSWDELVEMAESEFNHESPLDDNFEILSDIRRDVGREDLHKFVREQLTDVKLSDEAKPIASLPWFTAFTTNFDTSLEEALAEYHSNVRTVLEGREFALSGSPSDLLCVKLMGSVEKSVGEKGSMVLTTGEKETAHNERTTIFRKLGNHAANLSFLFIGYSFEDRVFTNILNQVMTEIGELDHTFYAYFPNELDDDQRYKLDRLGVIPIVGELEEFVNKLVEKVAQRDTSDHRIKSIPFGNENVRLSLDDVGDFIESYDPVLNDEFNREIDPQEFFKGNSTSFKPFIEDWNFNRKQEERLIDLFLAEGVSLVSVSGSPGSGRTFLIKSVVQQLINKERGFGIQIPSHTIDSIPNRREFNRFLESIEQRCDKVGIDGPKFCVFFSTSTLEPSELVDFARLKNNVDFELYLLTETPINYTFPDELTATEECESVDIQDEIPRSEQEAFKQYVIETVREHRLPEIDEREIEEYLREDPSFLPVMYKAIDPARRSIQDIIREEYDRLSDDGKRVVRLVSLASSVDLALPLAVCRRIMNHQLNKFYSFPDVIDIVEQEADEFVIMSRDARTNQLFLIYHSLVAEYICKEVGEKKMGQNLKHLAESVELTSGIEAEFTDNLLIHEGRKRDYDEFLPYSRGDLLEAMDILTDRQPARPILHHQALLMQDMNKDSSKVISILEEALAEPPEDYAITERKHNILTSVARLKWEVNKNNLKDADRHSDGISEIFAYLDEARDTSHNLHPDDLQANILMQMAEGRDDREANELLTEAITIVERAVEATNDFEDIQRLQGTKTELYDQIDREQAERLAEDLVEEHNDGSGYYTLARLDLYQSSNPEGALQHLMHAMAAEKYPPEAIAFRIKLLLQQDNPAYELIIDLAKDLDKRPDFEDSWESAYHKAIAFIIDGNYNKAHDHFEYSHDHAPRNRLDTVDIFWKDSGQRKEFTGRIGTPLVENEGWIYSHGLDGWDDDIYFDPSLEEDSDKFKSGRNVKYHIGFTPRAPKARNVEII